MALTTLEQLRIFVAVAELEHVTHAAERLNVTQSAASSAVATIEARHGVKLFHRVGRGIELTDAGHMFLEEARAVLARAADAERALAEFHDLKRGSLCLVASQTIASYWLPEVLARFHARYPLIALDVALANTEGAAQAVLRGDAELGFIEGEIDDPALASWQVASDELVLIGKDRKAATNNNTIDDAWLARCSWIMREKGSGTRSTFETAVAARGLDPKALRIALTLPSNEAVLAAVRAGLGCAVLSRRVVDTAVRAGLVEILPLTLPERPFRAIRQIERYRSRAADALLDTLREAT